MSRLDIEASIRNPPFAHSQRKSNHLAPPQKQDHGSPIGRFFARLPAAHVGMAGMSRKGYPFPQREVEEGSERSRVSTFRGLRGMEVLG
jgi:hypothetical protein